MAGVLISRAVSQRSRSSSTILAWGLRTANDLARAWPKPDLDGSLDRSAGVPGEAVPEEDVEEPGPMGMPLYSACGGAKAGWSPEIGRDFRASRASRTLTMA